jgi:hypothetical protein
MRLKELFTHTAQERDAANQARDNALSERNQLLEENKRLREQLSLSASANWTDSGYSAVSTSEVVTRSNSFCMSEAPIKISPTQSFIGSSVQGVASIEPPPLHPWEETQSRCSATWAVLEANSKPANTPAHSERSSSQRAPSASNKPPAPIDYDELGLDFVLTWVQFPHSQLSLPANSLRQPRTPLHVPHAIPHSPRTQLPNYRRRRNGRPADGSP